ncbi:MAG: ABC transporter ATP-binding protein [Planctomycetia bacterium]|nr:ABC transporter ATP-binding protein [Planctomycetia bacterium]
MSAASSPSTASGPMSLSTSAGGALARAAGRLPAPGRAAVWSWSVLSAAALLVFLVLLAVTIDVLATRGDFLVRRSELDSVQPWAGAPDEGAPSFGLYLARGLAPLAAHSQGATGWLAQRACAAMPAFAQTDACLLLLSLMLFAVGATCVASLFALDRCAKRFAVGVAATLRRDIHRHAFVLGGSDLAAPGVAGAEQLFGSAAESVRYALARRWKTLPQAPLLLALLVAAALGSHVWLALTALLSAGLLWYVAASQAARARRQRAILGDRAALQMDTLLDGLAHVHVISGYLLEDAPGAPFLETSQRHTQQATEWRQAGTASRLFLQLAVLAVAVALLALLGINVASQRIGMFEAALFASSLCALWLPLQQIASLQAVLDRGEAAAAAVFRYLDRVPDVGQSPSAIHLPRLARQVQFENVTLRDKASHRLLDQVSLALPLRGRVAVLSTDDRALPALAALVARFADPTSGRVLWDGQDVRDATFTSLRRQTALVLQKGLLFSATVAENIACGETRYTEDDVIRAARLVQAYDFIQRLPQGLATPVGRHGLWLDPSEALRIGLARAVLRDPALLIVEEPWEEIDPAAEALVDQALAAAGENRALLILATRLATLRTADRVLFFHEGSLRAEGPHADLVQQNDLYRHVLYLRFNEYGQGPCVVPSRQAG